MPAGFPDALIIGTGSSARSYRVAGVASRTPRWQVAPVPSQIGEFQQPRIVSLGRGSAGIIGSRRTVGEAREGVADVTNGDTSFDGRYGAGPNVTTIDLSSAISVGTIGGSLTIGASAIAGGVTPNTPTAIWADRDDDTGSPVRYIYTIAGGRIQVIDPLDDSVVETTEITGVDGGDEARWAGRHWLALRGASADLVRSVATPFSNSNATSFALADFTAINIHAGPDALYRAFNNFAGNTAIIKKTTSTTVATVEADANWAPSSGETMSDPSVPITRLATLGERLIVGKQDGLYEFDTDFTARVALEWMAAFFWEHNCNFILPVGQAGEHITSFRRGLYLLPLNIAIGTEALPSNSTDKKGRYTAGGYDGNWIDTFIESPSTDDTHLIKMRVRRTQGPGLFEHHPIATLTDTEVLTTYLWPGATIGSTVLGPRLYFGHGSETLAYIRLGETQPDQDDSNWRVTTGAWTIEWPLDDFDSPGTLKMPYKVEAIYENVASTTGITWAASNDASTFTDLDSDGTGSGTTAVTTDGFAQRFGNRTNTLTGRELAFRISGTGSSATAQQRAVGEPVVTILEQPEMVDAIRCTLQLETTPENDDDAELQWRTLKDFKGQGPQSMIANFGDEEQDTVFFARVASATRSGNVDASGVPGVILAELDIRALDFS